MNIRKLCLIIPSLLRCVPLGTAVQPVPRFVTEANGSATQNQAQRTKDEGRELCLELCATYLRATVTSIQQLGQAICQETFSLPVAEHEKLLSALTFSAHYLHTGIETKSQIVQRRKQKRSHDHRIGELISAYATVQEELIHALEALLSSTSEDSWWLHLRTKKSFQDVAEKLKSLITEEMERGRTWFTSSPRATSL